MSELEITKITLDNNVNFLTEYQGEVHDFKLGLPTGILNKFHTGIGATTCELNAERNSILVFPFRRLAEEKSLKATDHAVMYVGTDSKNNSTNPEKIFKFLHDNQNKYKKFCIVANSIKKTIDVLEESDENPFENYFLLLDEVEILQMQSGFRKDLPLCFDYFKRFKSKCYLSATLLEFSDKEISSLPKFEIEYPNKEKEKIEIIRFNSKSPHAYFMDYVRNYLKEHPRQKLLLGINSISAIKKVCEILDHFNLKESYSILISQNSEDNFEKSSLGTIDKYGKLPNLINISTSAFWSGIDITEDFQPVAISIPSKPHHSFSYENFIQFIGRRRFKPSDRHPILVLANPCEIQHETNNVLPTTRLEELQSLLGFVNNKITFNPDKQGILAGLENLGSGLLYKNYQDILSPNWLLGDMMTYETRLIDDYSNGGEGLESRLNNRFEIISDKTLKKSIEIIEIINDYDDEMSDRDVNAFLSHITDFSIEELFSKLKWTKKHSIKVICYWYLIGKLIGKSDKLGIDLAKFFSLNSKINYKRVIPTSQIVIDIINLYSSSPWLYKSFALEVFNKRNQQNNVLGEDVLSIMKKPEYFSHFTKLDKFSVSIMFNCFYGKAKTSSNKARFKVINLDDLTNPWFFSNFKNLDKQFVLVGSTKPRPLNEQNLDLSVLERHLIGYVL